MAMGRAILAVAALAAAQLAAAADYKVGSDGAWDASGKNYNAWAAAQKFKQGDTLSFTYSPSHDVTEVSKAGYDACSGANAVKAYNGGATTVKLATAGKHYFICAAPGHCANGMKLEVTVAAAAATAPAPAAAKSGKHHHTRSVAPTPAPAAAPTAGEESTTPTAAPAPKSSDAAGVAGLGAKAVAGLAVGVALALAM
ncbi:hypothetical protein ACP4OV_011926 [Aristida adscensionis]